MTEIPATPPSGLLAGKPWTPAVIQVVYIGGSPYLRLQDPKAETWDKTSRMITMPLLVDGSAPAAGVVQYSTYPFQSATVKNVAKNHLDIARDYAIELTEWKVAPFTPKRPLHRQPVRREPRRARRDLDHRHVQERPGPVRELTQRSG